MSANVARTIRAAVVVAAALAATAVGTTPAVAAPATTPAPLLPAVSGQPTGKYIVVLKPGGGSAATSLEAARKAGGRKLHRYQRVLNGFSGALSAEALDKVRADPNVAYVQTDARVKAVPGEAPATRPGGGGVTQDAPSWGLDRIDQRTLPLNGTYTYDTVGTGATVFVLDSGIRDTHTEFGDRARFVYNAVEDGRTDDCHGHGTHVAGIIGGSTYGVAKNAQIRSVRVLDCFNNGTYADLIEGLDYVATHAPANSVANMSLQGYGTVADEAVERLLNTGVLTVFIAGNFDQDACSNGPRSPRGIVVGATGADDARVSHAGWWGSNYGPCVDLFAPGEDILSADNDDDTATRFDGGTSSAAPHVTGWVARYLETHPGATMAETKAALLSASTPNVLTNVGPGSPNRLLHTASTPGTVDTIAPTTPGTPTASGVTSGAATLSWAASSDAVGVTGYEVERAVGTGTFEPVGNASAATFSLTGLSANTSYRVRVRAYDAAGNLSGYSAAGTFVTRPAAGAGCRVNYTLSSGGSSFTANLSITNTGTTAINGWSLAFDLPTGQNLTQPGWSAVFRQSGRTVTATPASWNGSVAPGQSVHLGFNGTGTGTARPGAFTLNGTACTVA